MNRIIKYTRLDPIGINKLSDKFSGLFVTTSKTKKTKEKINDQ